MSKLYLNQALYLNIKKKQNYYLLFSFLCVFMFGNNNSAPIELFVNLLSEDKEYLEKDSLFVQKDD